VVTSLIETLRPIPYLAPTRAIKSLFHNHVRSFLSVLIIVILVLTRRRYVVHDLLGDLYVSVHENPLQFLRERFLQVGFLCPFFFLGGEPNFQPVVTVDGHPFKTLVLVLWVYLAKEGV